VQLLQVLRGGAGGLVGIATLVHPPVLLQAVPPARRGNELPHALGLGAREGARLEGALHQGHVGQVLRDALRREGLPDPGQVAAAAGQGVAEPLPQLALVEVDAGQDRVVEADLEVVGLAAQRVLGHAARVVPRLELVEREVGHGVDGGVLGRRLREAVAGGQGLELVELYGPQRAPVGLPQLRRGHGAARRAQVDAQRLVELRAGAVQVALPHLGHPGVEVRVGLGDEGGGAVDSGGGDLGLAAGGAAAVGAPADEQAQCAGNHHPSLIRDRPPEPGQKVGGC
jgi:hypothetical protein